MLLPRSIDLGGHFHQTVVADADVAFDRVLRGNEGFVAPGRLVEENAEWGVTFSRLFPYTTSTIWSQRFPSVDEHDSSGEKDW